MCVFLCVCVCVCVRVCVCVWEGGVVGVGLTSKNRPSHHKYKFPKQCLSITYFEIIELKGSKRT